MKARRIRSALFCAAVLASLVFLQGFISLGHAADVKELLKQINSELRQAERNMFGGKSEQAVASLEKLKEKIRLADFEEISRAYEHVMLNSDFESAYEFINPDAVRSETDFTAYKDIKIVEYQVKKGQASRDKNEVNQSVKIKYYRNASPTVRTIRYEQLWKYDHVKKTWLLQTGLPKFK